jgi:hypothetical protein
MTVTAPAPNAPMIEAFARQGYIVVNGIVPTAQAAFARRHLENRADAGTMTTDTSLGMPIPAIYGDAVIENLMALLLPRVEFCTGLQLYPTYSYARVYKKGDRLPPHRDRPACEISVSVNLGQVPEAPWALCIEDRNKVQTSALLKPGDGLIYRGIELTHWREPYTGERLVQSFLHYVDRNGPHAGERFDRRPGPGGN